MNTDFILTTAEAMARAKLKKSAFHQAMKDAGVHSCRKGRWIRQQVDNALTAMSMGHRQKNSL